MFSSRTIPLFLNVFMSWGDFVKISNGRHSVNSRVWMLDVCPDVLLINHHVKKGSVSMMAQ